MKITDTYKALKKKHSRFFSEYNADDRIKHKKEIISLKKSLDELEIKIITGICFHYCNFLFNYIL